jgi:hypothetical protein
MKKFLILPLLIILTLSSINPTESPRQNESTLPSHDQTTLNAVLNLASETHDPSKNTEEGFKAEQIKSNVSSYRHRTLLNLLNLAKPINLQYMPLNILKIILQFAGNPTLFQRLLWVDTLLSRKIKSIYDNFYQPIEKYMTEKYGADSFTCRIDERFLICKAKIKLERELLKDDVESTIDEPLSDNLTTTLGLAIVKTKYFYWGFHVFEMERITIQHNTDINVHDDYFLSIYKNSTNSVDSEFREIHDYQRSSHNNFNYINLNHDADGLTTRDEQKTFENEYYFNYNATF